MGQKLGRPLVEETGKPRIHPQTLPAPQPAPEPEKEKEKVPTASQHHIAERAYNDVETAIQKTSKFLGISEAQVANILLDIAQHIVTVLKLRPAMPRYEKTAEVPFADSSNPLD